MSSLAVSFATMSHSTRVRGLKYEDRWETPRDGNVALYTSAWIEILSMLIRSMTSMSHSTRVRGLKLADLAKENSMGMSHSTRVRGLK